MKKVVYKRSRSDEGSVHTHLPIKFDILVGEVLLQKHHVIYLCPYNGQKHGILYITSYRMYFQPIEEYSKDFKHLEVPLCTILKIKQVQKCQKSYLIKITCKDVRKLSFEIENSSKTKLFQEKLTFNAFPTSFGTKTFAFSYSEVFENDGWNVYNPVAEFERMGIKIGDQNVKWRITYANRKYKLCETYPAILAVPGLKDNELEKIARFRSKNRLPVLSWIHPQNFSTITRCSQPNVGVKGNRSAEDERYINVIRCTHSFQHKLTIADCRPMANAVLNKAKGGGYETSNAYPGVEILFLKIQNIHVIRESLVKLKKVCLQPPVPDKWFMALEDTMWLKHIKQILVGAIAVVDRIKNDNSVVVHCSDGWDRTPQVTSLAMFMLDPYYRTIKGFEVLIEKEWLSFGHKFQQRNGHGDINHKNEERSPIFVQFIDCVWQIQQQYPTAMEFNERFLLTILDHLYSCRFGTFISNTERERELNARHQTISLWSWINSSLKQFKNKAYSHSHYDILQPETTMHCIGLWRQYYCQMNLSSQRVDSSSKRHIESVHKQVMREIEKLDVSKVLKSIINPFDVKSEVATSSAKFYQ